MTLTRNALEKQDPWLLKSLMAVEGDLHDFINEPMLFVVYGRGRALPPFIGKGITASNLVDIAEFITGACSCTVKEQNPGVDLLMGYDWRSAAATLAKRFGAEEGSEALGIPAPQLVADAVAADEPSSDEPAPVATEPANVEERTASDETNVDSPASAGEDADDPATPENEESASDVDPKVIERNEILATIDERYAPRPAATATAPATPTASPQFFVPISLGLAVGFVMLVAVMFLVLKPL
jgi:hypothetical protein